VPSRKWTVFEIFSFSFAIFHWKKSLNVSLRSFYPTTTDDSNCFTEWTKHRLQRIWIDFSDFMRPERSIFSLKWKQKWLSFFVDKQLIYLQRSLQFVSTKLNLKLSIGCNKLSKHNNLLLTSLNMSSFIKNTFSIK